MANSVFIVREAQPMEFTKIGQLMVDVYARLDGFLSPAEHPDYYKTLVNVGDLAEKPSTKLLIAVSEEKIGGGVVYFGDIAQYGAGGIANNEKNAAGFRLLAVDSTTRGQGIGKLLTNACIDLAKEQGHQQIVIHSTTAMKVAWTMYEKIGFVRSEDLDFSKDGFPVFGFRLTL